jgi:hypothetical protein
VRLGTTVLTGADRRPLALAVPEPLRIQVGSARGADDEPRVSD